jgi:hypothetical protein
VDVFTDVLANWTCGIHKSIAVAVDVEVEVKVLVDVEVDVDVEVEVDVVVVSQPLHVLSHWASTLLHNPSAKIISHCAKGNTLCLFAQRWSVDVDVVVVLLVEVDVDEVDVDVDVLVDVDVVLVVVSQLLQVLLHWFAIEGDDEHSPPA